MHLSLLLLAAIVGVTIADDYWRSDDWDDDNWSRGYRGSSLLPRNRRYFRRGRRILGSRGNSGFSGFPSYRRYGGYGGNIGYGGYGSYSKSYGSTYGSSGYLGSSYNRPHRRYKHQSSKISPLRTLGGIRGSSLGIRLSDDDDDFDSGFLGPAVVRPGNGAASLRPNIKIHKRIRPNVRTTGGIRGPSVVRAQPSFDNDEDDFDRGVLGPAVIRRGGGRAAVRPIDKKTYHNKISSVRPVGNIGTLPAQLPTSFDDDEDDFDNGILGPSVIRPNGGSASIRPSIKKHNRPKITPFPANGNIAGPTVQVRPSFDDVDDDDFNRGILGPAVGGSRGIGINRFQRRHYKPSHDKDYRRHYRPSHDKDYKIPYYRSSFDDDDFGSAPVFGNQPITGGGHAGHGGKFPYGNSYATGYGGIGGYGSLYGGGLGIGGGFIGRFSNRAGGGGGGGGGGGTGGIGGGGGGHGGDSDDNDFDDDNDNGSGGGGFGSSGGFGSGRGRFGGRFGGSRGIAGRFVGGGFGAIGGIQPYYGGYNHHRTYPKTYTGTKAY